MGTELWQSLRRGVIPTGDVPGDAVSLLQAHGCTHTATHCREVAGAARRLAQRWGVDAQRAEIAGWLHDVSAIVPPEQRVRLAEQWRIDVLPEERAYPMILHQKLSACIAEGLFGIQDPAVLSAIGCHTTLKAGASPLDQVVFVADKMQWDQPGEPPYLGELQDALDRSLECAALSYLKYLWARCETLPVVHPWLAQAYWELAAR